ncbi:thioredoxin domain-containing protein [Patulibacter sp. NPDC049589]|uniref:DsbA family protein n=1 Tax=Patulibacter sp. NPDC049589 TaxID=3154731 RepID=UPI00343EB956
MSRAAERDRARAARELREAEERDAAQRRRRLRLLSGAAACVAVVVAVVIAFGAFKGDPTDGSPRVDVDGTGVKGATETAALVRGLPQHDETLGRADAPATILEIADLKCPGCQAHEVQAQQEIVDRLVRTGKANLQMQLVNFRDAPAGTTDGEGARRAAYNLAASGRFWNFVHATYWNQGSEQTAWATPDLLRKVAAAAPGIEPGQVETRETPASRTAIANAERIARALKVTETPSLYVLARGARTGVRVGNPDDVDAIAAAVAKATADGR